MIRLLKARQFQVRSGGAFVQPRCGINERSLMIGFDPLLGRSFSGSSKVSFKCLSCGRQSSRWLGQCPQCKNWNTFTEMAPASQNREIGKVERERSKWIGEEGAQIESLSKQATVSQNHRIKFTDPELHRVFGGGIVLGSVILLAGTPGVGKSTLALQIADMISQQLPNNGRTLYVSGEESVEQVGMRAKRIASNRETAFQRVDILNQPNLNKVLSSIDRDSPHKAVVIDSIQTVLLDDVESDAGGVVQIRACALACVHMAKLSKIPVILVGHVTKSGDVAGPKMLEHLVDVVLYFDGESAASEVRWLHCHKNRFGPNEVGVFHLTDNGFVAMSESSMSFVSHMQNAPEGVAWCVTNQGSQGSRFVVAEVQALTNPVFSYGEGGGGRPRKTKSSGVPLERIDWLSAVIAKHVPHGKVLNQSDLFINVIGGLQTSDRGNDLAFAMAMASSALGREVVWPKTEKRSGVAFIGEIGLTGDVRSAHGMWPRINAALKAGLAQIVIPKRWWLEHASDRGTDFKGMQVTPVESLRDAVHICLSPEKDQPKPSRTTKSKI